MKLKKVLVGLGFAFGSLTLIAPTPSQAGPIYNQCLSDFAGASKISSFENLSSFCKCYQYVIKTEISPYMQEAIIARKGGEVPQEVVKAIYSIKSKCKAYIK